LMERIRFAALIVLLAALGRAQTHAVPASPSVTATGHAVVHVPPDQARIDIGVVTQQAPNAEAAASENASRLSAVLERLRGTAGPKSEIRTISYSVGPNYVFSGGSRSIKGYNAMNVVEVTTDDLQSVGKIVDAAMASGANEIQRLDFTVKNPETARAEALRRAAREAQANAQAMAGALGLKLGHVIQLEQTSPQIIRPVMAMAQVAAAPTPFETGTVEVDASVTLTVALE